jgi:TolB-like protein/Tfp pilus assembly protein PilF
MAEEEKTKQRLEIAHVLFMDIVDYSKLLTDEQSEALHELNQIVRNTEAAREAEAAGKLTILPTGDGMALVFTGSVEEPVECALEISHALRAQPSLPVRMGIHSGPIHHVKDANQRENIAGVGINIAQRVMDCGDAGHILISKRVADDLAQQRRWQPYLHELGDVEVKHGVVVSLVNFYAETIGNSNPPTRIGKVRGAVRSTTTATRKGLSPLAEDRVATDVTRAIFILAGLLIGLAIVAVIFAPAIMRSLGKGQVTSPSQVPAIPSPPSLADTIKSAVAKKVTDALQDALSRKKNVAVEPASTGSAIPEKSIAVLPFENLSRDPDNAYFAEGMQDEILARLSKIADLKVISRTSTQKYKSAPDNLREIAKQLGVANILEGSVQKAADQVRVNVQLINALNDAHLWGDVYDRKLTDIFAVESDIATTIADTLQAKLTGAEKQLIAAQPTSDLTAYELYLKGRLLWSKRGGENLRQAIAFYEQAITLDPNYALAYAGLAEAYAILPAYTATAPLDALLKAKTAAVKALQLHDKLAEAHTALALLLCIGDFDMAGSISEFQRAIALNPNYATAHHWYGNGPLTALGRFDEAIAEGKRAIELDPLSPVINTDLGQNLYNARRYDEAIAQLRKTLEIDPTFFYAHFNLGIALQLKGDAPAAIAEYTKAQQLTDNNLRARVLLAAAEARSGEKDAAARMLAELEELSRHRSVHSYWRAQLYLSLGKRNEAIRWLEQAIADHEGFNIAWIKVDPMLDGLRGDPRFEALVQKVVGPKQK